MRLLEVLAGGTVVAGPVRTLPADQAGLLDEAVVSVALVPVVVDGHLWGYIGFDDCFMERGWSAGELEALRAAADILGSAIHVGRTREVLEASEAKYREFVEQLPEGVVLLDGERWVVLANPVAREALQVLGGEAQGALWVVVLGEVTGERESKRQLQIQERLAAAGQLAAGIAHDFDNTLQTIVLHCELARRVREAGLCPRIVLMTGYPLEGDAGELERLGVVACLRKPFTMAQLAGVVHDALSPTSD